MAWSAPRTFVAAEVLTAAIMNQEVRDNLNAGFPTGSLHYYIRAATTTETLINGFALECNATQVSRTTYSALNTVLSALSYPFGVGNGSSTMHLPDLQARVPVAMASGGHTDVNALGDSDGFAKASRTPEHGHSFTLITSDHSHSETALTAGSGLAAGVNLATTMVQTGTAAAAISGTIGPNTNDTTPYLVAGVWAVKT